MKSMTGYGTAEGKVGKGILFAEIRSVNSRFLDINCKIPNRMNPIEPRIKKLIQNSAIRGKVEVFIKEKKEIEEPYELRLNLSLAKQYKKCLHELSKTLGIATSSHLLEVVDLKDLVVFHERPVAFERLWKQIERLIKLGITRFDGMRKREGLATKRDQMKHLGLLRNAVSSIGKQSEVKLRKRQEKTMAKLRKGGELDESRIGNEVVSLVDKIDITEELARLASHIGQYRSLLDGNGPVGRQLDFLLQEMHREINTLGSKANDASISRLVVDAKSEIERLREQVQNVE